MHKFKENEIEFFSGNEVFAPDFPLKNVIDSVWFNVEFISNKDEYYDENTEVFLIIDCTNWEDSKLLKDGWGFFVGYIDNNLDSDTCGFQEFTVYYKDQIINNLTYREYIDLISKDNE